MASWRGMTNADIEGVLRVASEIHPDLPESAAVFAERLSMFPDGCLILTQGDDICGYAVSHPIRTGHPPALDSQIGEIAPDADQYYIHDLAILPRVRTRGLGAQCMEKLLLVADRYQTACLISVYNSASFWRRFGFVPELTDTALSAKLRGYGQDAVYLVRRKI
ncbi:unnamed protein product [Clonostachys rosea f. rosea IK726]|uniref:Uncharacterized protein n=1 Tax=Clonostachys rosea f. rosea IK726 TaxID=1349383 RepID=A0ACA9UG21_BIOOC|nr:unnamed protein product [Clonostachys rosea f. rosea IK726]